MDPVRSNAEEHPTHVRQLNRGMRQNGHRGSRSRKSEMRGAQKTCEKGMFLSTSLGSNHSAHSYDAGTIDIVMPIWFKASGLEIIQVEF